MMETFVAQIPTSFDLIPPYQPMDHLLPSGNPYPSDLAFTQQWPTRTGQPLNTLSMNFQTRNTNSLRAAEGSPSPYHNLPTSMGSSGAQQKRINASQTHCSPSLTPQSSSFIKHSTVGQQNDRPFKCDQCLQSFNRNHDFKRHTRIHLAVKPFPCGHCEKSFSRKDALKRHVRVKGCGKNASGNVDADEHTIIDELEAMGDSTGGERADI